MANALLAFPKRLLFPVILGGMGLPARAEWFCSSGQVLDKSTSSSKGESIMYKSWTKRFARKIWKSPLALAVTAGILAGAGFMPSAFAAEKADGTLSFNSAITGTKADTEYINNSDLAYTEYQQMGGVLSSTYIFNWDKSDRVGVVSLPGIHLDSQ